MRHRICPVLSDAESETVDMLIANGFARSRADLARLAILEFIENHKTYRFVLTKTETNNDSEMKPGEDFE